MKTFFCCIILFYVKNTLHRFVTASRKSPNETNQFQHLSLQNQSVMSLSAHKSIIHTMNDDIGADPSQCHGISPDIGVD